MAREICCEALIKPSKENCDAAYLFGKSVLSNANQKNEEIKHLKGLLCTSYINCNTKNLDGLAKISDEVIAFKIDEIDKSEIHIVNAYLVKITHSIFNGNINDANAYMNIASYLIRNYQHSKLFDVEMFNRMQNMISLQKNLISKITEDAD